MINIIPNTLPFKVPASNNMGLVRYFLGLTIVIDHFVVLSNSNFYWPINFAVGGFFSISGFLMIGSYLRRGKVVSFIKARSLRLFPAYWATVIIFAFLLGFFSTESQYFFCKEFWKYLVSNIFFLNFLSPSLPGVFEEMNVSAVNGSLWTMKVELLLYLSVPVFVCCLKYFKNRPWILVVFIYTISMIYRTYYVYMAGVTGDWKYILISKQLIGQLMYFYSGALIYIYYDVFMKRKQYILPLSVLVLIFGSNIPYFSCTVQPLFVAFLVISLSFIGKWGAWENKYDNVSYNIYLTHFPIIQLALFLSVDMVIGKICTFLLVYLSSIALAVIINKFIEKPLQKYYKNQKKQIVVSSVN